MTTTKRDVEVTVAHGTVPQPARQYLARKIQQVMTSAPAPVLSARASFDISANPAHERPVAAKAALDVNGRVVRGHVAADDPFEAADLLADRLGHAMQILAGRRRNGRHRPAEPAPGRWRHGMHSPPRPAYHPRPVEEREVVRRKTFAVTAISADEAADEMALLDHDFYLFVDLETGSDALAEWADDGTVRVTIAGPSAPEVVADGVEAIASRVPTMTEQEAIAALDAGQLERIFFLDADTGRGAVAYRRYDGHYGVVVAD